MTPKEEIQPDSDGDDSGQSAAGDPGGAAVERAPAPDQNAPPIRMDKWLWHARFFKTRGLAAKACSAGKVRIDGEPVAKAHFLLRPGMVLTFPRGPHVRVVRMLSPGTRRGPAPEARMLYEDLAPPPPPQPRDPVEKATAESGQRNPGAGRPTKADRRALDRLRWDEP